MVTASIVVDLVGFTSYLSRIVTQGTSAKVQYLVVATPVTHYTYLVQNLDVPGLN